jgi:amidase
MGEELWGKSAREMAALVRAGEVTSRQLVEAHLERIAQVNDRVNAVVELLADEALEGAVEADKAVRRGDALGPLHGVPYTVKSNIDYRGSATTEGVKALKELIAPSDAPMVAKLRAGGAIAIGRTNMPDFGLRINSESELYGATRNPWDPTRTAGGSSGGEAAAIATGMSPMGLGNDLGGSLRNPAYCCGVASIKPSYGRVAAANDSSPVDPTLTFQLMAVEGVLARTVGDVRQALEVVMGSDPRDPHAIDAPLEGPARPRRVALVPEPAGGPTDPDVAEGVRIAGRALAAEGYEVDEISPPDLVDAYIAWSELVTSGLEQLRPLLDVLMGEGGKRFLDYTSFEFPEPTPASLSVMHQTRHRIGRSFRGFFEQYPLIVGPTWTVKPFPLGWDVASRENALATLELFRFVLPANLLGLPAACVPTGVTGGLPTGVQVIGARFREDLCLDAAEAIERQVGVLTPIDPR